MRLVPFIRNNTEEIADEWVQFARDNINVADEMELNKVRDHIIRMLKKVADDMQTSQSDSQQEAKSKGNNSTHKKDLAAEDHGEQRVVSGFDVVQLSSEFRALRATFYDCGKKKNQKTKGRRIFRT